MGGEELKWRQLTHHQLMSPQGPHFCAHSTAKTTDSINNIFINPFPESAVAGLACTTPPTNTKFRLTFLLTRLREALYEDLAVSNLKSTITFMTFIS